MPDNLSTILNSVKPDHWTEKLKQIKNHIKNFDDNRNNPSNLTAEEIEQYLHNILPKYWDVFHTHNTARRRSGELPKRDDENETLLPTYHIGIFLVGYSSLPIALSLAEIQPTEQIYFLYSKDTKEFLDEIFDRLSAMLNGSYKELLNLVKLQIEDPSDPVGTFKRIKEIIDNIDKSDDKRIALDLTGGKKTMIGGGFTVGAIWASRWSAAANELVPFCDMYYIDSKVYDPKHGKPEPGTEFLSKLDNPYDVYNVQSNLQARKLFEKHNYEAAVNLWEDVKETLQEHKDRYGLETEYNKTVKQHRMSNCYSLWDAFYYEKAKNAKNRHKNSWGYNEKHRKNNIDILNVLSEVTDKETLFENGARIIHYAVDRYQNAIRRKESGKHKDAIVRFVQVIEMLCNYRIFQLTKDKNLLITGPNIQASITADPNQIWDFKPLIETLFGTGSVKMKNSRYHVCENYRLDVIAYNHKFVSDITEIIQVRNDFIHFNKPMSKGGATKDTDKLQNLAKTFLNKFFDEYYSNNGLTFDVLLELHRFRRIKE